MSNALASGVREKLVVNNYLHSSRWNFLNAAMGGTSYSDIIKQMKTKEGNAAFNNIIEIKARMENLAKLLEDNERKIYNYAGVSGPVEFSQKFFNPKPQVEAALKTGDTQLIAEQLCLEIIDNMRHNKIYAQYAMGINPDKVNKYVMNRFKVAAQELGQAGMNKKMIQEMQTVLDAKGILGTTFKDLEDLLGPETFIVTLNKTNLLKTKMRVQSHEVETFNKRTRELLNNLKDNNSVLFSQQKEDGERVSVLHNQFMADYDYLKKYKYKFKDYGGAIKKRVASILKNCEKEIFSLIDKKKREQAKQIKVESSVSGGIGYVGELSAHVAVTCSPTIELGGELYKLKSLPVGEQMAPKKLKQIIRNFELSQFDEKNPKTNKENKNLRQAGSNNGDIIAETKDTSVKKLRQDSIITINRKKSDGTFDEVARFGVQVKHTFSEQSTVHLQKDIKLNTLLGTMEAGNMIDSKTRDEILYILANYYYFRNNTEDQKFKNRLDSADGRIDFTGDTALLIRYINILLTAGLEFVLEPQIEDEIYKYTNDRFNEVNEYLGKSSKFKDAYGNIVGNAFYLAGNELIPVSYFYKSIISLIDSYLELLNNKEGQSNNQYFHLTNFTLKGLGTVNSSQLREDKDNALNNTFGKGRKDSSEWTYPDNLVKIGSGAGYQYINNAELGGYQIYMKFDELESRLSKNLNIN